MFGEIFLENWRKFRDPERTRERLLQAAFREVHRSGFQSAGIDTILAATNVTKGALYHHFDSKEALGYAVVDEIVAKIVRDRWLHPLLGSGQPIDVDDLTSSDQDKMCLRVPLKQTDRGPASESGTVISLRKCDRLDSRDPEILSARLRSEFGRIFREFLFHGNSIVVAGLKVRPFDPLYIRKGVNPTGASLYGPLCTTESSQYSEKQR
jgi:AcrR family transcriptional regulator